MEKLRTTHARRKEAQSMTRASSARKMLTTRITTEEAIPARYLAVVDASRPASWRRTVYHIQVSNSRKTVYVDANPRPDTDPASAVYTASTARIPI
jgi:nitrous oxide reductase accessory protein NosL